MQQDWQKLEADVLAHRQELTDRLVDFSRSDVLLFLSSDKKLMEQQKEKWLPIVNWINNTLKSSFSTTTTLNVPPADKRSLEDLKTYIDQLSAKEMTAFYMTALDMRSVLLALALVKGRIGAGEAFELSEMEELYQVRNWGSEPVAEARRRALRDNLIQAEKYLKAA